MLYMALVEQARQPAFYADMGVADTIDGRFDMIVLHVFLVTKRLNDIENSAELSQNLIDTLMEDMDSAIREFGVGDSGVSKRLKKMAYAFNGRMTAYGDAGDDADALQEVIARNIYRDDNAVNAKQLTDYTLTSKQMLCDQSNETVVAGDLNFAELA